MQNGKQGQRGQQRQASLVAVDLAKVPREDVRQADGLMDDQLQAARPAEHGQMYAATAEEAVEDAATISGAIPIHSAPIIVS